MNRFLLVLATMIAVSTWVGSAQAVSIYVDFPVTGGNGAPSSGFGAAAGIPGFWNSIDYNELFSTPLLDTAGAATGVTMSVVAPGTGGGPMPGTSGDDALLLNDGLDSGSSFAITFSDLPAGTYDFYTYAAHPSGNTNIITLISVDGQTAQAVQRTVAFSGYLLGETHALHQVVHDGIGNIVITAQMSSQVAIVNGLQIVDVTPLVVPEPTTLTLVASGLVPLFLVRRRRLANS